MAKELSEGGEGGGTQLPLHRNDFLAHIFRVTNIAKSAAS